MQGGCPSEGSTVSRPVGEHRCCAWMPWSVHAACSRLLGSRAHALLSEQQQCHAGKQSWHAAGVKDPHPPPEVVIRHHLSLDEAALKVGVDHARSLGGQRARQDGPAAHLQGQPAGQVTTCCLTCSPRVEVLAACTHVQQGHQPPATRHQPPFQGPPSSVQDTICSLQQPHP